MESEQNNVIIWNTPSYPKFSLFNKRLESFINEGWPIGLAQKPKTLAAAGFFYFGRGDEVVCYYCSGTLNKWEKEDDAWIEHAKHYPNCSYLILIKSRNFINNVQTNVRNREKQQKEIRRILITTTQLNNSDQNKDEVPPSENNLSLLQKIAKTYCKKNKSIKRNNALQETLTHLQDERLCKLCAVREVDIVFIPCGHLMVCKYCASPLTDCPVCRTKINEFVKVYFS